MEKKIMHIEYQCTFCGTTSVRASTAGRPAPGYCSRRPKMSNGKYPPHRWVINRKF